MKQMKNCWTAKIMIFYDILLCLNLKMVKLNSERTFGWTRWDQRLCYGQHRTKLQQGSAAGDCDTNGGWDLWSQDFAVETVFLRFQPRTGRLIKKKKIQLQIFLGCPLGISASYHLASGISSTSLPFHVVKSTTQTCPQGVLCLMQFRATFTSVLILLPSSGHEIPRTLL